MKALILAICMLCVPSIALAGSPDAKGCYDSEHQLRLEHKTGHYSWRWVKEKNKWCYHLGHPHQKTVSFASKPSPSKAGVGISKPKHPPWVKIYDETQAKYMWEGEPRHPKYLHSPPPSHEWWRFQWFPKTSR